MEFAVGVGGADVAVAPRVEPIVDEAFARASASVTPAETQTAACEQVVARPHVFLDDRRAAKRAKEQEKRRALVAAAAEQEKRARADGVAKMIGRLAANIRGNAERRDAGGAPLSRKGAESQQLSEAEEREQWKRDASAAVIAEKEARSRRAAVLKRPAPLTEDLGGLAAPSGPRLRRYKVKVGTGLESIGSAAAAAAGALVSSPDPAVRDAAPTEAVSRRLGQMDKESVQEEDSNAVSAGSALGEMNVALASSVGAAAVGGSMSSSDPVVREATPSETAAKSLSQRDSAFMRDSRRAPAES